jgi:tryptophanyl-tRNA synthetase
VISEVTGDIRGIDGRKMSKSYDNAIYVGDSDKDTLKKINRSFTTPEKIHVTDPGKPESCSVCLLRRVYDPDGYSVQWDECRSGLRGCGQSKKETAEIVNAALAPIRERRRLLESDRGEVRRILKDGAERAQCVAEETMTHVRRALKLVQAS